MNLSQMGFSGDDIRFGKLTMESDKYICMLEQKGGQTQLSIVDLTPGGQNISRPIGAEAAIMNPVSKVRHPPAPFYSCLALHALRCGVVCLLLFSRCWR